MNINFYYVDHLSVSPSFPIRVVTQGDVYISNVDLSMYPDNKIPEFRHYKERRSDISLHERTNDFQKENVMPETIPEPWASNFPESLSFHMHKYCEITRVLTGSALYIVGRKAIPVNAGDIILFNNYIPHAWLTTPHQEVTAQEISFTPAELFGSEFFGSDSLMLFDFMKSNLQYIHIPIQDPKMHRIFSAYESIFPEYEQKEYAYQMVIKSSLTTMFAEFGRLNPQANTMSATRPRNIHPAIKAALDYIRNNLQENITLQDVSAVSYMCPTYFSTMFKKQMDMTLSQYLNKVRIEKAIELLHNTDINIVDIGFQCGFFTVSNFYRAFHSIYGISPTQMRKAIRNPGKPGLD